MSSTLAPTKKRKLLHQPKDLAQRMLERRSHNRVLLRSRIPVNIQHSGGLVSGYIYDVSEGGMGLFVNGPIVPGSAITMTIQEQGVRTLIMALGVTVMGSDEPPSMSGSCAWCGKFNLSPRVIRTAPLDWRMGITLENLTEDQLEFVRTLLQFG